MNTLARKHIISEEVVRSRVPSPLKQRVREEMMKRKISESDLLREILCEHFGIEQPPHPWKKE